MRLAPFHSIPRAWIGVSQRNLLALAIAGALAPCASAQTAAKPAQRVAAVTPAARPVPATTQALAPCSRVEIAPPVLVSVGKSTVIHPPSPVTRLLLGNPAGSRAARPTESTGKDDKRDMAESSSDEKLRPGVAEVDVLLLSPTEVYLLGKSIGSTNVVLLDRSGQCTAFDVVVTMDTGSLQGTIGQLLPNEKGVRVASAFDSIVLMGNVSNAAAVIRVVDLATAYVRSGGGGASVAGANPRIVNMLTTDAPQQVMLEVKAAEVSKALLDRFGINFSRVYAAGDSSMLRFLSGLLGGTAGNAGQISGTGPNGAPLSSVGVVVGGTVPGSFGNAVGGNVTRDVDATTGKVTYTTAYGTVPGQGVTNLALDMQKTDGLVKVLAEPTVMAISGQRGSFLAGGKIFIPVAQDSGNGGRTVTLEEKEFGVSVSFLPTVMDGNRINLEVVTEVSELNRDGVGLSAPGVSGLAVLPTFTSRRAKTTVQLADGQSFAVGGLIKHNTTTSITAFPLLGELPVVGALFRSTQFQTDKSELVFVITPRLVQPLPPNYALPTDNYIPPTRSDLILNGRLEGRRPEPPAAAPTAAASGASTGFQVK